MKHAVLLALAAFAACGGTSSDGHCKVDGDCGGQTCARDGECLPASQIRMVHIQWTVHGQQANPTNCAPEPSFELSFTSLQNDFFGYAPVPCMEGVFTMDKMPDFYTQVELDGDSDSRYLGASAIGAQDTVSFDLPL